MCQQPSSPIQQQAPATGYSSTQSSYPTQTVDTRFANVRRERLVNAARLDVRTSLARRTG